MQPFLYFVGKGEICHLVCYEIESMWLVAALCPLSDYYRWTWSDHFNKEHVFSGDTNQSAQAWKYILRVTNENVT